MNKLQIGWLRSRREELKALVKAKQAAVKKAPAGRLRCCRKGKRFEYYRLAPGKKKYSYIAAGNIKLAAALAQGDYDKKILKLAKRELKLVESLLDQCLKGDLDAVYRESAEGRKQLIHPFRPSDEEFVEEWLKQECCQGTFGENDPEYYTMKGERVRSKSEVFIGNALYLQNVPYLFERQIYLNGYGNVLPDFTVLDVKTRRTVIWEHFGRLDDPDYVEKNLRKINAYLKNGYIIGETLILTFESGQQPLNTTFIDRIIEHYFL